MLGFSLRDLLLNPPGGCFCDSVSRNDDDRNEFDVPGGLCGIAPDGFACDYKFMLEFAIACEGNNVKDFCFECQILKDSVDIILTKSTMYAMKNFPIIHKSNSIP